jgi:hypothetical protein
MRKLAVFIALFWVVTSACTRKAPADSATTSGKINTISVIIDDQLWNGQVGDSIRNTFAAPVLGLPQEEPLFDINQYPVKLLEGFVTSTRNILVVKKAKTNAYELVENEYATPQNVFHISGKTAYAILEVIRQNAPDIIQKMQQTEIVENQRLMDTSRISTRTLKKKFGVDIHLPTGFTLAMKSKKFLWYKKEITSGNSSVLVYQVPFHRVKTTNLIKSITKIRDSIGRLFIHGSYPNTQMITQRSYTPYLFKTKIKHKETFVTKGNWELKNDHMTGPFINYCIVDYPRNRMLIVEGFCYAPSTPKRDLMFELESIIKSVEFLKKSKTKYAK